MQWFFGGLSVVLVLMGVSVLGNPLCDGDCGNDGAARVFGVLLIIGGVGAGVAAWMLTWSDDDR